MPFDLHKAILSLEPRKLDKHDNAYFWYTKSTKSPFLMLSVIPFEGNICHICVTECGIPAPIAANTKRGDSEAIFQWIKTSVAAFQTSDSELTTMLV